MTATMQRSNTYSYPFAVSSSRYHASHSTSSAQSASANPDEDWTKISDLAERRRIQNRIAQRNYRKKLKRRLEDLERRAGSDSASPEPENQPSLKRASSDPVKKKSSSSSSSSSSGSNSRPTAPKRRTSRASTFTQISAFAFPDPSSNPPFARQYARQGSPSPPPAFSYTSYASDMAPLQAPYPQQAAFHSVPSSYADYQTQQLYLPPLPTTTLPSMPFWDPVGSKPGQGQYMDDGMGQFNMNYTPMTPMDAPTTQTYANSNPYTPPLSLSNSFDQSRDASPCEPAMMEPGTPLSMPLSPHFYMG